jgi:hypothetical protein
MFLFTIKSRTKPKSKAAQEYPDIGGAYVSCYIAFEDFGGAEKLAALLIRDEGWIPEKRIESWKIQKAKLRTKKDKQYYAEAVKYGYCLVFNMWPKNAPDADNEHESESKRKTRLPRAQSNLKRLERTRR